jgi:2-oxoglutarate dehydrogenase E1 component
MSQISARLNLELLDSLYAQWKANPSSVDAHWNAFFEGFDLGLTQPSVSGTASNAGPGISKDEINFRGKVARLIDGYRILGHMGAHLDPLSPPPSLPEELTPESYELGAADLGKDVETLLYGGGQTMKLSELLAQLRQIYCDKIGFEYRHISNREVQRWLRERIEKRATATANTNIQPKAAEMVLRWLAEASRFERFLHRTYVGQKRFGLEGGESLMVMLNQILENGPALGVQEIVMGMAHRGRLTVLANFLQKPIKLIFNEFSENYIQDLVSGDGDVKYHLGYENDRTTLSGEKVKVFLAPNPSHLEAVDPVVEGNARARQRLLDDTKERKKVIPILIHGDAAFAGQGLVAETLNLSKLPGYRTGGTIHLVINNQIGFTTSPADARSSRYCTDVAKMIDAPIFHVNGDEPMEVAWVAALALDYRQTFGQDVVIDMVCYRRHGHNEGDEPVFNQPTMVKAIQGQTPIDKLFAQQLNDRGVLSAEQTAALENAVEERLTSEYADLQKLQRRMSKGSMRSVFEGSTAVFQPDYSHAQVPTGLPIEALRDLGRRITEVAPHIHLNDKIDKNVVKKRREASEAGGPYDWAHAEHMAFGSLLMDGVPVRLSGQDVRRGTFSHRHCMLYDAETRERYSPLQNLTPDQAKFCVYNSLLSEAAVLGFDYGYSLKSPNMLICWEAQFGDFVNGAQVIIDQFIASAESKWQKPSSIVLLLPHGYEGQGPEHSSGRMERFLQLCADQNMQICNLTTPAQYFHVLRRQVMREFRKPLVLFTPKSLLRDKNAVSTEAEMDLGTCFQDMIDDPGILAKTPKQIQRIIFCTGKVFYDLLAYRNANEIKNTAIIRIEQLYPWNDELLANILAKYTSRDKKFVWCQEEPLNMGAWSYIVHRLEGIADTKVRYAGRDRSASPAVGSKTLHDRQQRQIVEMAFEV